MNSLEEIQKEAELDIMTVTELSMLDQVKAKYLGKQGFVTGILKQLAELSPAERPAFGQAVNLTKNQIQAWLEQRMQSLKMAALNEALSAEAIDVTLPGRGQSVGSFHPVSQALDRFVHFFSQLGFVVVEGPEIEDDFHNFTALNIPPQHPARETQDTFYLQNGLLLRTQTSSVQIRTMQKQKPPLRIISPGRVYRCDFDATHTPMFNQVECLWVDEECSFANLKAVLHDFLQFYFARDLKVRFRPSYFPFTEPSAELDMQCVNCQGDSCRVCKGTGWLEILGCGMVHPNVLSNVGIDNERYTGFAFGLGLDRLAMLRYQIDDLRLMFENDLRFLKQF